MTSCPFKSIQGCGRLMPRWRRVTWRAFGRLPVSVRRYWLGWAKVRSNGVGMHRHDHCWGATISIGKFNWSPCFSKGFVLQFQTVSKMSTDLKRCFSISVALYIQRASEDFCSGSIFNIFMWERPFLVLADMGLDLVPVPVLGTNVQPTCVETLYRTKSYRSDLDVNLAVCECTHGRAWCSHLDVKQWECKTNTCWNIRDYSWCWNCVSFFFGGGMWCECHIFTLLVIPRH